MIKTTTIICQNCNKKAQKRKSEIDRQLKRGRTNFYCSRECSAKHSATEHLKKWHGKYNNNLKKGSEKDEYSDFRWYMKVIRKSSKERNHTYNVDCSYLKQIWEQQNGICPITNRKLELRTHSYTNMKHPYSASLDRIDNTKGYVKDNVRFVSLIFNYARNTFSDNEVIDFCKAVIEHN